MFRTARHEDESWTETYTQQYTYDFMGNVLRAYNIDGDYAMTEYDDAGRKIKIYDVNGVKASTQYYTEMFYDNLGRLIKQTVPFEEISSVKYYTTTKTYYDNNGNVVKSMVSDNSPGASASFSRQDYEYNSRGFLTMVTTYDDGTPENYTQYYYDAAGNKLRMYTGLNSPLTISGLDQVSGSDVLYSVTQYAYDHLSRMTAMTDPMGNSESYSFDIHGNLTIKTDRNGNEISYTYDYLDRVLTDSAVHYDDSSKDVSSSYTYNKNGSLHSVTSDGVTTTYEYDDLQRMTKETISSGQVKNYSYDISGNNILESISYNSTTEVSNTFTYDKLDRMNQAYSFGSLKATYAYDDNGNRQSVTNGNGTLAVYTYNLANSLKTLVNSDGTNSLSSYTYNYLLNGNRVSEYDSQNYYLKSYTFDGLGRIESEIITENSIVTSTTTYTYDDYNNRASKSISGVSTTTYSYDDNNRLTVESTVVGSTTTKTYYTYDDNGNQLSTWEEEISTTASAARPSVYVLGGTTGKKETLNEYDALNRLIGTVRENIRASYTYDAKGLRNSKTVNGTTTTHVWSGSNIVFESDGTNGILYVRGINLITINDGSTEEYYHFNGHGDVVHLTDGSKTITEDYKYDAFGIEVNPSSQDNNPFRYSGEYFDKSSNTYYLRARYYNPNTGRFISEDSYWGETGDPLSLNLYIYCANNPIIFWDPSGYTLELSMPNDATKEQKEEYERAYDRAVEYLKTSDVFIELFDRLENSEEVFTINFTTDFENEYNLETNEIKWCPSLAMVLGNDKYVISPALALAHEMGHGAQDLDKMYSNWDGSKAMRLLLEEDNLNKHEIPIAEQLGEYTRKSYIWVSVSYHYTKVSSSTDWGVMKHPNPWWYYLWPGNWGKHDKVFQNKNEWEPSIDPFAF